jgi:hypothetical protein
MRAGNIEVQRGLMWLLTLRTEPFLRGIATRIERAQSITAMLPDADVTSSKQRKRFRHRRSGGPVSLDATLSHGNSGPMFSPAPTSSPKHAASSDQNTSIYEPGAGFAATGGGHGGGGHQRAIALQLEHEHDAQIENVEAIFKLLQRMTEGHFAPMQNFLRAQASARFVDYSLY